MFKSVQWKLATMFLLVVLAVIILIGTFTVNSIANFYCDDFVNQIETAITDDFTNSITAALSEKQPEQAVFQTAEVFSARFGINSYRSFYVLDSLGNNTSGGEIVRTENIITAIKGKIGSNTHAGLGYMDYAYPIIIDDEVSCILYIRDTKEEVYEVTRSIFNIIIQALIMGILLACLLGILLAKSITTPISNLTTKAEKIAQGEFEHISPSASTDEIGKLTNTFSYMSGTLKATLEEIQSERDKVETVIHCMTDGVTAFNQDGKIIHINPAAKTMLDISDTSSITFNGLFRELGTDVTLGRFLYLDVSGTVEKTVEKGSLVLNAFITPFRSESDKTAGVVVVWQDDTKRQKLEEVRREFVANVSHELKTPLTTIKSYTETLIDDELEDKDMGLRFLGVVNNEVDRMTRIVTDLLLLSRIDYSQTEWKKTPFHIDALVKETVEKFMLEAKKQNLTLTYEKSSIVPMFTGDRDRMAQVITNILSNAVKYTPEGGSISVYAGHVLGETYIKVKDTGIGIPKDDLKRIFERFYRVDKARSRAYGGTGLGLSIAKEIVEAHNGSITMESAPGEGTTVIIRLPTN